MTSRIKSVACVAGLVVGMGVKSGIAQVATQNTGINPLANAERAANLYGREIVGSDNQPLGKVDNVIVDLESEHVLYVVISTGHGKVAVPPQIIGRTTGNTLRANVAKAKLEGAPKFASNAAPDQLSQASFVYQVYQYFGANPWWQGNTPANQGSFHNVHKLNELIGMSVQDVNNQPIGKISNVVVDMSSGRLLYAVFSPASSLGLGNNLYAMPSDAFTLGSDQKHLVTNIDKQKLSAAPHFDNSHWPTLTDPTFAFQVYQYYGKQAWFNTGNPNYQPTGR
jgi:sporulation protein YlmC with PRC-barrel domain